MSSLRYKLKRDRWSHVSKWLFGGSVSGGAGCTLLAQRGCGNEEQTRQTRHGLARNRCLGVALLGGGLLVLSPLAGASLLPDWLAGHWCRVATADSDAVSASAARGEELWWPARGSLMLGMARTLKDGQTREFEFLRIEADDSGNLRYLAQPGGRPPTVFTLIESADGWLKFANPKHDFPQSIEYRRDGDRLTASIAGPGDNGEMQRFAFHFRACIEGD